MSQTRIYADFQNLDDFNQLRLTCAGTLQDLQSQGIQLQEGMVLTFYTDDADDQGQPDELRAEGIVHYDKEGHSWVAAIDWNALRHASEEGFTVPPMNGPISKKLLDEHTEQCRKQVELGHESQETLDFFVSLQQDLAEATEMVRELNTIRNKMAHKLDSKEFNGRLHEFVKEFADNQNLQNRGVTNIVAHLYGMVKALCDLSVSDEFSLFRS